MKTPALGAMAWAGGLGPGPHFADVSFPTLSAHRPHLAPILRELPVSRGTEGSQNVGLDQSPAVNFTSAGELAISIPRQQGWDTSRGGKAYRGSDFGILFRHKTLVS